MKFSINILLSIGKLHQMLGDLLAKGHDEEKAMHHYNVALNLDPKNISAQEGLQKMEHATDTAMEPTYDLEMDEMNSDEAELEELRSEADLRDPRPLPLPRPADSGPGRDT